MVGRTITVSLVVSGVFTSQACADVLMFRLDEGDREAWDAALAERFLIVNGEFDFCDLPDWGIIGNLDEVSCEGNRVIPPGFIPCWITLDCNMTPHGIGGRDGRPDNNDLDGVGTSSGFGSMCNALVASYFVDGFDIYDSGSDKPLVAMEFRPVNMLGENRTDITVFDQNEEQIAQFIDVPVEPGGTTTIGLLATDGDVIGRVNLWDNSGTRGIEGAFKAYSEGPRPADVTSIDVVVGTRLFGKLGEIAESDDSYLIIRSGFGERLSEVHHMQVLFGAVTNVNSPESLSVSIESHVTDRPGIATIAIRNWRTNEFDRIGQYAVGLDDQAQVFEDVPAADHVRVSGAMELSIKHVVFVPFLAYQFDSFVDLVRIEVE